MKQISQEEFEGYIRQVIQGETSKVRLAKELEIDVRKLNNKIQELSITNPSLYQTYVEKFPYQPRERKDLDAVQLALEFLSGEKNLDEIAEEHQTGRRTIRRRLDTLKNSESELERYAYQLCRAVASVNSRKAEKSPELEIEIQKVVKQLEERGIDAASIEKNKETNIEERRAFILQIEKRYNELCLQMPKEEAARAMGYTRNRIWKLLNELYRIEIEMQTREKLGFREGLKVDVEKTTIPQEKSQKEEEPTVEQGKTQSEEEPTI